MRLVITLLTAVLCLGLHAQSSPFTFTNAKTNADNPIGKTATLDLAALRSQLQEAPREFANQKHQTTVHLPLPDGEYAGFQAVHSPLLKGYAEITSYQMIGPWGVGRLAVSPRGVSGLLRGPDGYFVVENLKDGAGSYLISTLSAYLEFTSEEEGPLSCGADGKQLPNFDHMQGLSGKDRHDAEPVSKAANDPQPLRIYDVIITNTGEFATQVGGDTSDVIDAYNTVVSVANGILETEVGVRLNLKLVPELIFLDGDTDPFENHNEGIKLLDQVIGAFNQARVSTRTYDLGHLLTVRCIDGVAGVVNGLACTSAKTRGVTCISGRVISGAIRAFTHEIAHQFDVDHTWNSCPGSQGQRRAVAAFEPGGGTTIMSYNGFCGDQNYGNTQPYFHVISLQQFKNFITGNVGGGSCPTIIETDNLAPEVSFSYTDGFFIPISTPFKLEGTGTDPNDDQLKFNWEQLDTEPRPIPIQDPVGNAPLFRTVLPSISGNVRYFPRLDRILTGAMSIEETLPTYSRDLTFRLTARDENPAAGAVDWKEVQFRSTDQAGPFVVNNPASTTWTTGEAATVTWDVANTDQAPVNCQRVNILLSNDSGRNFDVVLASNVPNTGSATFIVPDTAVASNALIMVEAADNVFLNVNSERFVVQQGAVSNRNPSVIDAGLTVFPNPVTDRLQVSWTAAVNRKLALELLDVNGRLLQRQLVPGVAKTAQLSAADLPTGVYLLRVDGAVRRIVKR